MFFLNDICVTILLQPCFFLVIGLKLVHIEALAVPRDVGEMAHPVAGDQDPAVAAEHQVEHDVPMPEDEEIDIRVRLQVFLGEGHQILARLALVFVLFLFREAAFPAAERPAQGEPEGPAGVDPGVEPLAETVAEDAPHQAERPAAVVHLVAMPQEETLAQQIDGERVAMDDGADLAGQVVEHPDVENKLKLCTLQLEEGKNFSEVVESANLFSDFDLQMIRTGTRTGQLEAVLRYLDSDYNRRSYDIIQNFISRLEPTIILVLAIATGMVLLSVMLPLVGILSSIG